MSGRRRNPSVRPRAAWLATIALLLGLLAGGCGEASAPESAGPPAHAEPFVEAPPAQSPSEARTDRTARLRRLAAAEARRRGLDATPAVRAALEEVRRGAAAREEEVLRDALFARIRDGLVLSEEELRAHYEANRIRYTERRVRLRRQHFASEEEARAAEAALGPEGRLAPAAAEEIGPLSVAAATEAAGPEVVALRRPGERALVTREGASTLVELVEVLSAEPLPFESVRGQVEKSLRALRAQEAFRAQIEAHATEGSDGS
jgi:hypothetical protein